MVEEEDCNGHLNSASLPLLEDIITQHRQKRFDISGTAIEHPFVILSDRTLILNSPGEHMVALDLSKTIIMYDCYSIFMFEQWIVPD